MVSALESGSSSPGLSPGRGTAMFSWAIPQRCFCAKRPHPRALITKTSLPLPFYVYVFVFVSL